MIISRSARTVSSEISNSNNESSSDVTNEETYNVLGEDYSSIKKTTQVAQLQYKENVEKYNALKASFKSQKDQIEKELETLKGKVDKRLMERYLQKRANKIYPIVFPVSGAICGACRMELSMSELTRLKNGEIIDCDQCGRLLYLDKND